VRGLPKKETGRGEKSVKQDLKKKTEGSGPFTKGGGGGAGAGVLCEMPGHGEERWRCQVL